MNVRPPVCSPATATVAPEAEASSEEGSLIALVFSLVEGGGVRRIVGDVAEADLLDHRRRILALAHRRRTLGREHALIPFAARGALAAAGGGRSHCRGQRFPPRLRPWVGGLGHERGPADQVVNARRIDRGAGFPRRR